MRVKSRALVASRTFLSNQSAIDKPLILMKEQAD
jgi:hypothetical protein